jgi:hypothetical protein
MGYLGLVPCESSTGDTVNRGGIAKAGNGRARRILVEAAWSYRHPPRVSLKKQIKVAASPQAVREIAWKAQRGRGLKTTAWKNGSVDGISMPAKFVMLSIMCGQFDRAPIPRRLGVRKCGTYGR